MSKIIKCKNCGHRIVRKNKDYYFYHINNYTFTATKKCPLCGCSKPEPRKIVI